MCATYEELRETAERVVVAHDALSGALAAEAVDEAIEAEKRLENAIQQLRTVLFERRAG